jgi:hypothetical protein
MLVHANLYRAIVFDHGVGHSLLLLYDAKALNCQKSKEFNGLGYHLYDTTFSFFEL